MDRSPKASRSGLTAGYILGNKLDSISFSAHHLVIIVVLRAVGFVEGYDLALGGSLLMRAKRPSATISFGTIVLVMVEGLLPGWALPPG